jgi:hypothetical protein
MILFRNVGSVLKTFDRAIKDLDAMIERGTKKTERGELYKEKVTARAERKIIKAQVKRRAKREAASEYIATLKSELTRAANAVEKLSEISGY